LAKYAMTPKTAPPRMTSEAIASRLAQNHTHIWSSGAVDAKAKRNDLTISEPPRSLLTREGWKESDPHPLRSYQFRAAGTGNSGGH